MKHSSIKGFIKYLTIYFNTLSMISLKGGKDHDAFKKNYLYLILTFSSGKYQSHIVVSSFYVTSSDNARKISE